MPKPAATTTLTLIANKSPFPKRILEDRKIVLIRDTKQEKEWQTFKGHVHLRSWRSVPLLASEEYLGFLSVGHEDPNRYTQEHLRRAELLAIPAAAAIQNARLYARAEIYSSELEECVSDLHQAETALAQAEGGRKASEEKFQKVFRSSPIPFSITTLKEGRFLDVNTAFERRYGYSREEVFESSPLGSGNQETIPASKLSASPVKLNDPTRPQQRVGNVLCCAAQRRSFF